MPPSEPGDAAASAGGERPDGVASGQAAARSVRAAGAAPRPGPFPPRLPEPAEPPVVPARPVQAHQAPAAPEAERVPTPGAPNPPGPGPVAVPPTTPPGLPPSGGPPEHEVPPSRPVEAPGPPGPPRPPGVEEPGAASSPAEPETPPTPPTLDDFPATGPNALADIWQRALGLAIDSLLCLFPVMLVYIGVTGAETLANEPVESVETPVWVLASFVVSLAIYQIVALSWTGQTFAMWVVGIRCARYLDGKKPTPSQAAIRSLFPAAAASAPFPFSMTQYVIYLSAMFDPLRRAWHDQAGGTIIVRTR